MRPLLINPEREAMLAELAAWAALPENVYRPGVSTFIPGDRPEYVRELDTFRVVFSITEVVDEEDLSRVHRYRHLSISIPGPNFPNLLVTMTIAALCGFTGGHVEEGMTVGPGPDWHFTPDGPGGGCATWIQEIPTPLP